MSYNRGNETQNNLHKKKIHHVKKLNVLFLFLIYYSKKKYILF